VKLLIWNGEGEPRLGQEISEATGTRAIRQHSMSGEHSRVRQYCFLSRLPLYSDGRRLRRRRHPAGGLGFVVACDAGVHG
jgi:hypothetical protein